MKFCQLVERNMRNIFLEKSYTKFGRVTSPRPIPKNSKLSISLDQLSDVLFYAVYFYCVSKSRTTKIPKY